MLLSNGKIEFTNPVYNDMLSNSNSQNNVIERSMYNTAPRGIIAAFYKNTDNSIPVGWAICNGQIIEGFQTPNLVGKFIKGGSSVGDYSNNDNMFDETNKLKNGKLKLSIENMPSHSHSINYDGEHNHNLDINASSHSHTVNVPSGKRLTENDNSNDFKLYKKTNLGADTASNRFSTGNNQGVHIHETTLSQSGSHTHTLSSVGEGIPLDISPPWYSLVYIIKYK